ncbi:hypothetical protein EDD16DRAFT_1516015 [Pisolithus croceorrhizus]|nr:hypothetical protein EV401DRAFT_1890583 [Pisolithus croceorrhizus]KAI6128920.1 hypothetical protein EDD16DRAFT_1516015 [Pisolithus croceorrhizus]
MFIKNSLALQDAVNHILTIFKMLIVNLGRSIANRTDNVLHMLIGMDKYIHWMENISIPGIPFPNWHQALFPLIECITGHLWLLTVKWQYDAGLQVQPLAPTTEPVGLTSSAMPSRTLLALRSSTMPCMTAKGSAGHILTCSTPSAKGKARATSEGMVAMLEEISITWEDNNREESKVIKEDIKMDEAVIKPACGQSQKQGRGRKGMQNKGEDTPANYAIPPPLQCNSSAYIPLPAPPILPTSAASSPVAITPPQPAPIDNLLLSDQMIRHIDEGERQMACVMHQIAVPTPGTVQDNSMQTPQVDTDVTATSSNVVEMQDESVRSPHSELKSREVMPIHREPPVVDQGVELLTTESSDNGRQDDQGEAANITEATAVAGEAEPIIGEEGGISGEHHQMTEENSGECPTEGEGGTTILVSKGQVGEVSCMIAEEELGLTGGKFMEEH